MRYANILLPFFAIIFLLSCQKEDNYWGTISAQKNGISWSAKIRATTSNSDDSKIEIIINILDQDEVVLETLGFYKVPRLAGRYFLSPTFHFSMDNSLVWSFYTNGYQDQLYDTYLPAPQDSTSYLEITEFNGKNEELRGRFNLTVWPDIKGSWNAQDSIVFSHGEFHTKIRD
jgi:hypothetical protein